MKYMKFLSLLALIAGMGFSAVTGQQPEGELWEEFTKGLEQTRAEGRERSLKSFKRYIERIDRYAAKFNPTEWKEIIDRFFSPLRTEGEMLEAVESGELEKNYFEYKLEKDLVRLKKSLQKLLPLVKKEAVRAKRVKDILKGSREVLSKEEREELELLYGRKPKKGEVVPEEGPDFPKRGPFGGEKEKGKEVPGEEVGAITSSRLRKVYDRVSDAFTKYDYNIIKPVVNLLEKIEAKGFAESGDTKSALDDLNDLLTKKQSEYVKQLQSALSELYGLNDDTLRKDVNGVRFVYDKLKEIKGYLAPITAWDLPEGATKNKFAERIRNLMKDYLFNNITVQYSLTGKTIGNWIYSDIARLNDVAHIE